MKVMWLGLAVTVLAPLPATAQDELPRRYRERSWSGYRDRRDLTEEQRDRMRALREERRESMRRQGEELRRMRETLTDEQRRRAETLRETARQNRDLLRDEAWRREMVRREFDRDLWRREDLRRQAREGARERRRWDDYWYDRRPRFRRYPI